MRIVTFSTSDKKAFQVDTETRSVCPVSLNKSISDALRDGKAQGSSVGVSTGNKFCGYSRKHDCLVTIRNSPPRVSFHKKFSKTLAESAERNASRQMTECTVTDGMEFQPEGKIERRRRLKKERQEKRQKDKTIEPHTVEIPTTEHVSSFFLHPAEDYFILGGKTGGLTVWGLEECGILKHWEVLHYGGISSISVSGAQDHILTTGEDDTVRLWMVDDVIRMSALSSSESTRPAAVGTFRFPGARILCAKFLPFSSDRAIMTTKDGFVRYINLEHGSTVYEKQLSSPVDDLLFSPCQRYLIVSSGVAQTFAMNLSEILRSHTSRRHVPDLHGEMRLDMPVLFPDEKEHTQTRDIFLSIARRASIKQHSPHTLTQTKLPLQLQLVSNHRTEGISTAHERCLSTKLRLIGPDLRRSRVFAIDSSGGMIEWTMTGLNQCQVDCAHAVLEPIFSNPHLLPHSIDFACIVSESLCESAREQIFTEQNIPSHTELNNVFHPPFTMPSAKRKMHEDRASRKPNSTTHLTRPSVGEKSDERLDTLITDMIPFDMGANFEKILGSRLQLQNMAQSLRDEILHLERISAKMTDGRNEEPTEE